MIEVSLSKALNHVGHRLGVVAFANGRNIAVCCEECHEVLGDADVATCDICDQTVHIDDMDRLGGDEYIEGYAPQAVPAVCQNCADAEARRWGMRVP